MPRQRRTLIMCNDCVHLRTTFVHRQLSSNCDTVTEYLERRHSLNDRRGRRGGRLKARLLRRLSVRSKKVKFSHTRYRALGPELIPVYRQSACR